MSDTFIFKSLTSAVVDNGSGMMQGPDEVEFEDPLFGLTMPRVLGYEAEEGFEDPLFGYTAPRDFEDPLFGYSPETFEDPLFG